MLNGKPGQEIKTWRVLIPKIRGEATCFPTILQNRAYVFRQHLRELKVKQSFSTPGNPYDNSVCESFFHTLKKEALYHHLYETPQELEEVLEEYIEFYNGYRPHRKLNMKTPIQYEAEFFSATEDK